MLNKNFFKIQDNDISIFRENIDIYRDNLLALIDKNPTMSVLEFKEWDDKESKIIDDVLLKYVFLFTASQKENTMSSYNEMIKYYKDKLSDFSYNKEYFNFISNLHVEDESDKVWKEKQIKDFLDRGLNLPKDKQDRLIEISKELTSLSVEFLQNINMSKKEWSFELPSDVIENLNPEYQKLFTNNRMSYNLNAIYDILENEDNAQAREKLFKKNKEIANVGTAYDNSEVIKKIVSLKHENATILGKKSVCDLVLEDTMSENIESATSFLNNMTNNLMPFAIKEDNELLNFVKDKYGVSVIEDHSLSYYSNRLKEEQFSYKNDEERQYLKIDNALSATFKLVEKLFDITFEKVEDGYLLSLEGDNIPTYKVFNKGKEKGLVIFDFYERESKKAGAWVSNMIAPTANTTGLVALTTNFDKNKEGLCFGDLKTLLHEFGHLIHAVSSETKYRNNSGTNGLPRDAVEIPSQMLEKFSKESSFLNDVSNGRIPEDLVIKAKDMEKFRKANFYTRQVGMSLYDLEIYTDSSKDVIKTYKEMMDKSNPREVNSDSNFPMIFAHIFSGGYSSGYYGYLWSDVYSVDAFSFIKENPNDRARLFKEEFLAYGSSKPAKELYEKFKGETASFERFLDYYDLKQEQPKRRLKMK